MPVVLCPKSPTKMPFTEKTTRVVRTPPRPSPQPKVADRIGARPRLVPLPFALWQILALAAELLPGSPLTRNQVALMQHDNVPSVDSPGLSSLDITPTEIDAIGHG